MSQNYRVAYSTNGTTFTTLSNVQAINIAVGRQKQLDQYNASTASIDIWYPTGFSSPITALVAGTQIRVENVSTSQFMYYGTINDVIVNYGIPYAGGVGNADRLTVTAEGFFARFARAAGND